MRRALAAAAMLMAAGEALAQTPQVASPTVAEGMVAQPCPPQEGLTLFSPAVRQNDWAWACKYRQANAQLSTAPRAVFIGDSITENWIALAPALFAGGNFNRGIGGQTSPQVLLRFYQDVVRLKPKVVHIMVGTNDLAGNTGPNAPDQYIDMIRAMTDIAATNRIAVILGSIAPASGFPWKPKITPAAQIIELNRWLRDYARVKGLVYADYHAVLADPQGAMKPAFTGDGVHPNAAGYAAMEPVARAALAEAVRKR
jgi:lysophospholipase L1-like esterase